jgi:hypothetical protein
MRVSRDAGVGCMGEFSLLSVVSRSSLLPLGTMDGLYYYFNADSIQTILLDLFCLNSLIPI